VLHHIENGDAKQLLDLHRYLYGPEGVSETDVSYDSVSCWREGSFKLFLSHVSEQKVMVAQIKEALGHYGISAFVAHEDIQPTKEWLIEIEKALDTCDAMAAILTPTFHQSYWTDHEIGFCVRRRVLIVPVKLGLDPYGFISKYQALQANGKEPTQIAQNLFESLLDHPLTKSRMEHALVAAFEQSASYKEAKLGAALLGKITTWSPEMLRAIEQAVSKNSQISGAWGVPAQIAAIVREHSR
jgi:hypothetical protein